MTIQLSEHLNHTILLTPEGEKLGIMNTHFDGRYLADQKMIIRTATGRGTVYFFALNTAQLALRHYKRGGLVARISDDKFLFRNIHASRCYKELSILQHLLDNNVNVPRPIAARVTKLGLMYRADIISEVIEHAAELHEQLQTEALPKETWQAIGAEIKKMHCAQVFHGDINVKNILIASANDATIHLLDFDKCAIKLRDDWKIANLMRLKRSLIKQSRKYANYHYSADNWEALLLGYENKVC